MSVSALTRYITKAATVGLLASFFFWGLGLTMPTRKFRAMVLNNTGTGI